MSIMKPVGQWKVWALVVLCLAVGFAAGVFSGKAWDRDASSDEVAVDPEPRAEVLIEEFLAYQSVGRYRDGLARKLIDNYTTDRLIELSREWFYLDDDNVRFGITGLYLNMMGSGVSAEHRKRIIDSYIEVCLLSDDIAFADGRLALLAGRHLTRDDFTGAASHRVVGAWKSGRSPPALVLFLPMAWDGEVKSLAQALLEPMPESMDDLGARAFNSVLALARAGHPPAWELLHKWVRKQNDRGRAGLTAKSLLYIGGSFAIEEALHLMRNYTDKYIGKHAMPDPRRLAIAVLARWHDDFPLEERYHENYTDDEVWRALQWAAER